MQSSGMTSVHIHDYLAGTMLHHRHYNAGPLGALLLVTPSSDCSDVDVCSLAASEEEQQRDTAARPGPALLHGRAASALAAMGKGAS